MTALAFPRAAKTTLRREEEPRRHYPEAGVEGFEPLIDVPTNDSKDRRIQDNLNY